MKQKDMSYTVLDASPLHSLHTGEISRPLAGSSAQVVSENHGLHGFDHSPQVQKGGMGRSAMRSPKGMGRSVAKELMSKEKKKYAK